VPVCRDDHLANGEAFNHAASSERAQRNDLSALESRINLLLIRGDELEAVTNEEGAMMNLAMKCQEVQVLPEYEEIKKQVVLLRSKIRALRSRMRPMVMVSHLGIAEIDQIASRAYDSAVLEVATTPGHLCRSATWSSWCSAVPSACRSGSTEVWLRAGQGKGISREDVGPVSTTAAPAVNPPPVSGTPASDGKAKRTSGQEKKGRGTVARHLPKRMLRHLPKPVLELAW
jgi:hypothetical protein